MWALGCRWSRSLKLCVVRPQLPERSSVVVTAWYSDCHLLHTHLAFNLAQPQFRQPSLRHTGNFFHSCATGLTCAMPAEACPQRLCQDKGGGQEACQGSRSAHKCALPSISSQLREQAAALHHWSAFSGTKAATSTLTCMYSICWRHCQPACLKLTWHLCDTAEKRAPAGQAPASADCCSSPPQSPAPDNNEVFIDAAPVYPLWLSVSLPPSMK